MRLPVFGEVSESTDEANGCSAVFACSSVPDRLLGALRSRIGSYSKGTCSESGLRVWSGGSSECAIRMSLAPLPILRLAARFRRDKEEADFLT